MKAIELVQFFGWVVLGGLPLFVANRSGQEIALDPRGERGEPGVLNIFIASVLQIAVLVCAFKAGGR